jgi:hypothetical protein
MKQSSSKVSTLAALVLNGKVRPTKRQTLILAASVLAQDEAPGQARRKKPRRASTSPARARKAKPKAAG